MSARTQAGAPRQRVAPGASLEERILLHSDRSGDCWVWTACISDNGYGRLTFAGKSLYSHRVSYEVFVGDIPAGLELDHLCRNRACCNPFHLEAVTPSENVRRGMSAGALALRRELCQFGHSFAEHGVVRHGRRVCRTCRIAYMRVYNSLSFDEVQRRKRMGVPVVNLAEYFRAEEAAA